MAGRAAPDPGTRARRVVLGGIALGTAVVVLTIWNGGRPHLGSLPDPLALIIGVLALWFVFMVAGVAVVALLAAFGRELAQFTGDLMEELARAIGKASRALFGRAHKWAEPRYRARRAVSQPRDSDHLQPGEPRCPSCNGSGRSKAGGNACPVCLGWGGDAADPDAPPCPAGAICRACGRPGTLADPVIGSQQIHRSHAVEQQRLYRDRLSRVNGDATSPQPQQEGTAVMSGTDQAAWSRNEPVWNGGNSNRSVPQHWHAAATATADFHPDSDTELLDWMSGEVSGMLAYGEAVAEVHEHCVTAVRLDPAAMAALHDVADAAADFAEAMARAREKFRQVYEGPREFVNDGGVLPKDGDFLQGDDTG